MIVEQFAYLSPEAMRLRQRDGVPPWGVHVCELDSVGCAPGAEREATGWAQSVAAAHALRATIEADPAKPSARRRRATKE